MEVQHSMTSCPACQRPLPENALRCGDCNGRGRPAEYLTLPGLRLSSPMFSFDPHAHGIGGWLILVLLGLVASPVLLCRIIWTDFHSLTGPNHRFIGIHVPGLPALVGFELFANVSLVAILLLLLFFFFREDRRFPRLFQFWLGVSLVARMAEYTLSLRIGFHAGWEGAQQTLAGLHGKLALDVFQGLVAAVVWIWYFQVSHRVKATFVR
jgi:hypothetical protein